eukprot:COSAG06_NODE_18962_length_860_cov_0.947438_1_plen_286_part_11
MAGVVHRIVSNRVDVAVFYRSVDQVQHQTEATFRWWRSEAWAHVRAEHQHSALITDGFAFIRARRLVVTKARAAVVILSASRVGIREVDARLRPVRALQINALVHERVRVFAVISCTRAARLAHWCQLPIAVVLVSNWQLTTVGMRLQQLKVSRITSRRPWAHLLNAAPVVSFRVPIVAHAVIAAYSVAARRIHITVVGAISALVDVSTGSNLATTLVPNSALALVAAFSVSAVSKIIAVVCLISALVDVNAARVRHTDARAFLRHTAGRVIDASARWYRILNAAP